MTKPIVFLSTLLLAVLLVRTEPPVQASEAASASTASVTPGKVSAAGVTIVGQIECTDAGRWPVQREFNRRMRERFQAQGIAIANP